MRWASRSISRSMAASIRRRPGAASRPAPTCWLPAPPCLAQARANIPKASRRFAHEEARMSGAAQAVAMARLQAIDGTPEDKARVAAWDRLFAMLNALDSKTSALLRFNAIVVAALAYLVVVSGADPFAQSKPIIKTIGFAVGHVSLLLSVASCGFAFPVINLARGFFDASPGLDDG